MNKSLIFFAGVLLYSELQRNNSSPSIFYVRELPSGFNALTIPPVGIFILEKHRFNVELLEHELIHWEQFQREGFLPFTYGFIKEYILKGYDLNSYEIEARFNESEFCKTNYSYCVEAGLSNTVDSWNY